MKKLLLRKKKKSLRKKSLWKPRPPQKIQRKPTKVLFLCRNGMMNSQLNKIRFQNQLMLKDIEGRFELDARGIFAYADSRGNVPSTSFIREAESADVIILSEKNWKEIEESNLIPTETKKVIGKKKIVHENFSFVKRTSIAPPVITASEKKEFKALLRKIAEVKRENRIRNRF
ncbi:hypothetical protein KKG83_05680 [Candidatus Micrarchaeota archaeon]|nr:hypothetical protein [Candidatus Micrarchaeota archaeon]MBU2476934.1 hypothetical protein [Candidatus Micrarchaeota archaeon]